VSTTWGKGLIAVSVLLSLPLACAGPEGSRRPIVRITGSDTMVNLLQAWAEHYAAVRPGVSVHVSGGGSGVGIAGLIDGTLDVAAASREIRADERQRATSRLAAPPDESTVALDALAVYVHRANGLDRMSFEALSEIYGEGGRLERWSQLGVAVPGCPSDRIVSVGRQNNSGTFVHFRDIILGPAREYKLGTIDQSGSKDVVALVSRTPCALGYSGIAFATPGVRPLRLSRSAGGPAVGPSEATVVDGSYPLARQLYLYVSPAPSGHVRELLAWILSRDGQRIAREVGFIPATAGARRHHEGPP
jgi:phosphate transport system substrate-binding protein